LILQNVFKTCAAIRWLSIYWQEKMSLYEQRYNKKRHTFWISNQTKYHWNTKLLRLQKKFYSLNQHINKCRRFKYKNIASRCIWKYWEYCTLFLCNTWCLD
jgi:hypothetical protein